MSRQHFPSYQFSLKAPRIALLFVLFLASSWLFAQQTNQDFLLRRMDQIAQEQLRKREAALANIRNVADAESRKQLVHRTMISLLGGLPDYNGPLHARTTGRIHGEN